MRAAAASALPSPGVIPGAAVLLLPLDLPLKSDRKRRAAAPFAIEPLLAAPLDDTHVAVGPVHRGTVRLCAAIDIEELNIHTMAAPGAGVLLPDVCGVPLPDADGAWSVWFGHHAVYVRTFDGTGCVVDTDGFADLWRAFDRPLLQVCHGHPPPGVGSCERIRDLPPVPASLFELNMRPFKQASRDQWRSRIGFAVGLSVVAGLAHAAVLLADARALERTVTERRAALVSLAQDRGAPLDLSLPTSVLTADLERRANRADTTDPFLSLLATTGTALAGQGSISFRDLRFDAGAGTLTVLVSAPDLAALQQAEDALRTGGMEVTGGAASTGASGAEMQLILSEAP
ncbi:MAG: type II secretion system protein GspL [Pseudomonadota bacterium]